MTYKERLAEFALRHPNLYAVYMGDLRPVPPSHDIEAALNETLTCDACGASNLKTAFGVWCTRCERWHHVGGNCLGKLPVKNSHIDLFVTTVRGIQEADNMIRIQKCAIIGLYEEARQKRGES